MSTEWTIVKHGNKKVNVVETNISEKVRQNRVDQRKIREEKQKQWEEKQRQNQANWEARRQAKIDEYDREFPLLPGSRDTMTDAQKITYIDNKRAAKKEADRLAYLEREARRQAKRVREAKKQEYYEKIHVQAMIEKWGAHRWYNMVFMTDDDCITAQKLRHEEEEREYERERWFEEQERQWELEWEQQKIEEKKYIEEQTANMGKEEKGRWILEYEYQKEIELDWERDAESDRWYRDFEIMQKQKKEDAERLAAWELKNKNKSRF